MSMSPFGFVMQEVNAHIINHPQKHFMRNSWKTLPVPNTPQVWVFSVNTQTFLAFVLKTPVRGHSRVALLTSFLWFCLNPFGSCSHATGKAPPPLATQWDGWCEQNHHSTGVHQEEFASKVGGGYPTNRDISRAVPDSRNRGWGWSEESSSPEVYVTMADDLFQHIWCCKCLGAIKNTAEIQSEYRVKSTSLYQSYKGKANFSYVKFAYIFSRLAHCVSEGLYMCSLAQTV